MKSLKVALAEDSMTSALMMVDIFKDLGCSVEKVYSNGNDLLNEIGEIEYDVLFTDIELEGDINGIEMVQRFKKRNPTTPFFFITSHDDIYTLKAASATNPWGFLNKPLDKLQLRNTIELLENNKNAISSMFENNKALKKEIEMLKIMNKELSDTNNHLISATWRERDLKKELQESKQIIEEQHHLISDSINYAHRIQKSMVANEKHFNEVFSESFIFYKPKDVVSGDFPWAFKKDKYLYFAAVDCTGHGVPGAMLATIGTLILNDIVNNNGIHDTDVILNKLHSEIVKTLNQENDGEAANDGMDIALCRYNTKSHELQFSGAHRPLYVIRNNEVLKYKSCGFPIGGTQYKRRKDYKKQDIKLEKGDIFYIYSDGVPDQFGGGNDEKFGNQRISDIHQKNIIEKTPFKSIKEVLNNDISNWMNAEDASQTDDMLLISLKV